MFLLFCTFTFQALTASNVHLANLTHWKIVQHNQYHMFLDLEMVSEDLAWKLFIVCYYKLTQFMDFAIDN